MTRAECRRKYPGLTDTQLAALYGDEEATKRIWLSHLIRNRRRQGWSYTEIVHHLDTTYYEVQRVVAGMTGRAA